MDPDPTPAPKRKRGRPPTGKRKPDGAFSMKCNWEWREAVGQIARGEGIDEVASFIDIAIHEYCKRHRLPPPPPRISS